MLMSVPLACYIRIHRGQPPDFGLSTPSQHNFRKPLHLTEETEASVCKSSGRTNQVINRLFLQGLSGTFKNFRVSTFGEKWQNVLLSWHRPRIDDLQTKPRPLDYLRGFRCFRA